MTRDEVIRTISHIKSEAVGADNISLRFIKMLLPVLILYITYIFNRIITVSKYPTLWKTAKLYRFPKKRILDHMTFTLSAFCLRYRNHWSFKLITNSVITSSPTTCCMDCNLVLELAIVLLVLYLTLQALLRVNRLRNTALSTYY